MEATQESEVISQARIEQDLSLRDFAERLGVSHNAVAQWESGRSAVDLDRVIDWLSSDLKWVRDMAMAIMSCKVGPTIKLTLLEPNGKK